MNHQLTVLDVVLQEEDLDFKVLHSLCGLCTIRDYLDGRSVILSKVNRFHIVMLRNPSRFPTEFAAQTISASVEDFVVRKRRKIPFQEKLQMQIGYDHQDGHHMKRQSDC
jgi:hypothetical protein